MVDCSTPNIFALQDQLLKVRKELSAKDNEWKREKVMMMQKSEILTMEIVQLKHRQGNLKKVNETLSMALNKMGESDQINVFRNLIESLKNNTVNSNNVEQLLKQQRKKIAQEIQAYETTIRLKLEEEFKQKEINVRVKVERQIQDKYSSRIHQLQNHVKKLMNFDRDKSERELKQMHYQECQKLKNQLQRLYVEIDRLKRENDRLREQSHVSSRVSQLSHLQTSGVIPSAASPTNYDQPNPMKRTIIEEHFPRSNTNVATDILCEICHGVYPTYEFQNHLRECNNNFEEEREEKEQQFSNLLRQRKQVDQQIKLLQRLEKGTKQQAPKPSQQIMYVISDVPKNKKNMEKEIKNIISSICNGQTPEKSSPNVSVIKYPDEQEDYSSRFSIKNSVLRGNNKIRR